MERKVYKMQEQMGNVSREMEILRIKSKCKEIKICSNDVKIVCVFEKLNSRRS